MSLIILASLIIFGAILHARMKQQGKSQTNTEAAFWEREHQANFVRRKPLDKLDYITIPLEELPVDTMADDPAVADCLDVLRSLSTQRIVNLTGYTNTDLKLEYGTASFPELSEYDQNYTLLVTTLQKWADILLENRFTDEARRVMEFAVQTRTDVKRTYYRLAEIYDRQLETEKIRELAETAGALRSPSGEAIVRTLQESYL